MKRNLGQTDRQARMTFGLFIVLIGLLLDQWWGLLGFIPVATTIFGWCPIYELFGFSSQESLVEHSDGFTG